MRFRALATDYDGTAATDGRLDPATRAALLRLRASGRCAVLVTGRELGDLARVMPDLGLFDRIVAENGAVLHRPAAGVTLRLADPPPPAFTARLHAAGVAPLVAGAVIVATTMVHAAAVDAAIGAVAPHLRAVANREALMVLPAGVDKASGLAAALAELQVPARTVVAVGDAENDLPLLAACGLGVAVANAVAAVKAAADHVTAAAEGAGVAELVARILAGDL